MSALTTDDCKRKLVELYPATQAKSWKRTKKYLNGQKEWERVFECTQLGQTRTVLLVERAGQLIELGNAAPAVPVLALVSAPKPTAAAKPSLHPLPQGLVAFEPTQELRRLLFGATGPEALALPFVSPVAQETQFLLVLQNTIDWSAPEKSRSCFDFAAAINFKDFTARCTVQGIDVLGSFLAYVGHQLDYLAGLDEDNYAYIGYGDYDDSLVDLIDVLGRLRQGFVDNNWAAPLDRAACKDIFKSANFLKEMVEGSCDPDEEETQRALDFIERVKALAARPT